MTTEAQPDISSREPTGAPAKASLSLLPMMLLTIIAILLAGYSLITSQKTALNAQHLTEKASQDAERLGVLQSQNQELAQSQKALNDQFNHMQAALKQALEQQMYQNQDWLLLKARYYLELAKIDAQWTEHYETSTNLLQQADMLLKPIVNPKLLPVRQAIAKEISDIKALPVLDVTGLLSQLVAVQHQVYDLKARPQNIDTKNHTPIATEPAASMWESAWQRSLAELQKMVIVRHHDTDIKPMLSPIYQATVKEAIYIQLQQAQWAVIHKNQAIYELSLKQAITSLKQHFDVNTKPAESILKQLDTLEHVSLNMEKPTSGTALELLNQVIEQQKLQVNAPKGM